MIVLTGHGTVENAIVAMKAGAFDFVTKPCKLDELEVMLQKAMESRRVREENRGLCEYLSSGSPQGFITREPSMLAILESLKRVAASDVPVLIVGESGTGKELIARETHRQSPHHDRPFVAINCAVFQSSLLESELFGHEKGAFTGAVKRKMGLFEIAGGGAIFLDEVGEIGEEMQAKLLRVLQFGEFRRVGGNENLRARVRIIAATNKNLEKATRENEFRQDLYFRLNVVTIALPPLRERTGDIEILARHFLKLYGGKRSFDLTPGALRLLRTHSWPGNIRELENVVRRLIIFHDQEQLDEAAVAAVLPNLKEGSGEEPTLLADVEKAHILRILAREKGEKKRAAEILGISLKTLYNKLNAYGWRAERS